MRIQHRAAPHSLRFRLTLLIACLVVLALILVLRLAYLQFSQYNRYATLSLKNQMSIVPIPPPRGIIYDRHGTILANNIPVYVLEITPEHVKNLPGTLERLQALLPSITREDIENFEHDRRQSRKYLPTPLKLKLSQEEVATFASNQYQFPGVSIKARLMRHYPVAEKTAHLLGYVGRINPQELQKLDYTNYQATSYIGKTGIERYYEPMLHGTVGYQQIETDVSGRTLRVLSKQMPVPGTHLYLTLDLPSQEVAQQSLEGKRGAIVLLDVKNGEVLALASSPSFDPNLFVNGVSQRDYRRLSDSVQRPLFNRAVRGLYPPASTIKPFVALAALDKGYTTTDLKIYDHGSFRLPNISHVYRDWKRRGHGFTDLKRAITVSCDTYFYQVGNKMGINAMQDTLAQFGFGQLSNIDLFEEASGLLPSPEWKRRVKALPWYPGDTLITAIGQGFMLSSPLQLAHATAALAQHGRRFRPHLLQKSVQSDGKAISVQPIEEYPIQLKHPEYWNFISEAMQSVIKSREGTGHRFGRNAPYSVAAKTGTAQVFSLSQDEKKRYHEAELPEILRDHSLFIAFAPAETPEVAIAVLIENDPSAPKIARTVLDAYFQNNKQQHSKN